MFKDMSREEHFFGGQASASPAQAARGVAPLGHETQDSSWISMFSVVSRPALSFLQKYLPGRTRPPALSDSVSGWVSGGFKHHLLEGERASLGRLDDTVPATQHAAHHLSYLHCQHDSAACLVGSNGESWLIADSLHKFGIQNAAEMDMNIRQQTHLGYLATVRGFLSQYLLSSASAQETKYAEGGHVLSGKDWSTDTVSSPVKSAGSSRNWWGGFWGSEESSQSWLSNISWSKEAPVTSEHCPPPESGTIAAVAKPTELFVLCSDGQSMPGESAGPSGDKEEPIDNGSLQTDRPESLLNSQGLTLEDPPCISIENHLVSVGAVTACSEVAVLTPDQDNGYSSLEEEHSNCGLYMVKAPCEDEPEGVAETKGNTTATEGETEGEIPDGRGEGDHTPAGGMEEEAKEEETEDSDDVSDSEEAESPTREGHSAAATPLTVPLCQNKAIAYIMGNPCSDDDSQSDSEFSHDDDDDDGFDSEGSSEFSDSADEEDEDDSDSDSDDRADSEAERLWSSLCQTRDPYSPRNFTAHIQTSTAPRTIPASAAASAASLCSPHASPRVPASPLSSSPASPPSPSPLRGDSDTWDDSTSASEADEAESLRLWNSLSFTSDPYSPRNFQASLRTVEPPEAGGPGARGKKASRTAPRSPRRAAAASPPRYRTEEAEERLDSGFSETLPSAAITSATATVLVKKVRFCEEVEEFLASCGEEEEDRRGPWEELARDRCRFLRRCQEVEESIAYCLQPQHRRRVFQRLSGCCS